MDFVDKYIEKINDEIERKKHILNLLETNDINILLEIRCLIVAEYFNKKKTRMGRLKEREKEFNEKLKEEINNKLVEFDIKNNIVTENFPANQSANLGYRQIFRII